MSIVVDQEHYDRFYTFSVVLLRTKLNSNISVTNTVTKYYSRTVTVLMPLLLLRFLVRLLLAGNYHSDSSDLPKCP